VYFGGGYDKSFCNCGTPWKRPQWKHHHRCVCRHHGPRAPNATGSHYGSQHQLWAPNTSPKAFSVVDFNLVDIYIYHLGFLSLINPIGRQCLMAKGSLLLSLPFIFILSFGYLIVALALDLSHRL
jgi:hypothetical protein